MLDGRMHQTTLRLSPDLWAALEEECQRLGMSVAQYLREAAVARLAYTAGRRGMPAYEVALARAAASGPGTAPERARPLPVAEIARDRVLDAEAVSAQSEVARHHAREIRVEAQRVRALRHAKR